MRLAAVALIVLCIAGAALAQQTQPSEAPPSAAPFVAQWESQNRLSPRPAYPERALERGVAGLVHLCCSVQTDGSLACQPLVEWPDDYGFGAAAQSFAQAQRITPDSVAEMRARQIERLHVAMRYQVGTTPARLDRIADQLRDATTNLCGPNSGPAPDYIRIEVTRLSR